jgi:hypothetical protein
LCLIFRPSISGALQPAAETFILSKAMDTSVFTDVAAVAGAVSAVAGLAKVLIESPLFKKN